MTLARAALVALPSMFPLVACATAISGRWPPPRRASRAAAPPADPAALRAVLADTAVRTRNEAHGTQIEYHAAEGETWLARPGNLQVVRRRREIRGSAGSPKLCDHRGEDICVPRMPEPGGRWSCRLGVIAILAEEVVDDPVLRLRKRARFPRSPPPEVNPRLATATGESGPGPRTGPNETFLEDALP